MNTLTNFKGKTIVIAGGGSGMGFAIAEKALSEGALVHLLGTNLDKLSAAAEKLVDKGEVKTHVLDISNEEAVIELASRIDALDYLVTTAARLTFKPLSELTKTEISQMIDSKIWGPILLTKYLAPKINKEGGIVYFSGVAADKGGEGAAIVGAVNSALHGLAKNLAYELTPIRVNVVSPGVVQTPTWGFMSESDQDGFFKGVAESLPAKRVGQAEDLAEAALFLLTNKYITGTVLTVDGGANA
jgi:NAD(P)-dependent dehydrogenase (short-subunit alcohol dehydrogenase family)